MPVLKRTDATDPDFMKLVTLLDADLAARDGQEHSFYAPFNKINMIRHAVIAYENDQPVSCGAIKQYGEEAMEVKRMYTLPSYRGKGIAGKVLSFLEEWASEMGYKKCVLETGRRQPEAIALYEKSGYHIIPNYGQYAGKLNSVCFEKDLDSTC